MKKRKKSRGSASLLDVALSSLAAAIYSASLIAATAVYMREKNIIDSADEQMLVARSVAAWIPENSAAIIRSIQNNAGCYIAKDPANGWTIFSPSQMPIPSPYSPGQIACQSIQSMGLAPANISTNKYGQNYYVGIKLRTNQIADDNPKTSIDAILFTANGQTLGDDDIGSMISRFGYSGAGVFRRQPASYGANELVTFGEESYGIKGAFFTPGHTAITLTDLMTPTTEDSFLHKDSEPGNTAGNRMESSLFAGRYSSTNENKDNSFYMNGPASPWAGLADETQKYQDIQNGNRKQPHNNIYAAHQIDTQIITSGNSIKYPYATISDQSNDERSQNKTENEAGKNGGSDNPNTILVNAGFDVTQGYRLSAADGLHISASSSTYQNDDNLDNDNNHHYDNGNADHRSANYANGNRPIPGLTWDRAPNTQGSTSRSGLMIFLSADPTNGDNQKTWGITQSPLQTVIATYTRASDAHYPVGFEADGGARAPVFYDTRSMSYFVRPSQTSHMGDIILDGTNRYNGLQKKNVTGALYTSGLGSSPWPDNWAGTGVQTFDALSVDGNIAPGQIYTPQGTNQKKFMQMSGIANNGTLWASYHLSAGFVIPGTNMKAGNACLYKPVGYSDGQNGNQQSGGDVANWGAIGKEADGTMVYCSPTSGVWTEIKSSSIFNTVEQKQFDSGKIYNNDYGSPLFGAAECHDTRSGRSSKHNGYNIGIDVVVWQNRNGSGNSGNIRSWEQTGGKKGSYIANPHVQFIVPANGSFEAKMVSDYGDNPVCTFVVSH